MIVGLDIDGVLADFITPFLHLLAERTGTGPIDPVSVIDPNFIAHPFLTPTMIFDCMEAASYDAEFWRALTPLLTPKQWRELDRVSRTHQTVFITHRWVHDTYDINRVTCDWLRSHGVSNPVVYFTQNKKSLLVRELGIGLFVDDRHENCHDVASETEAVVFMPHRPYNQAFDHPKVRRIQQLEELFEYLADK
jgi:uncharacterized HAD superfamily protein